jgi:hypothetical protein
VILICSTSSRPKSWVQQTRIETTPLWKAIIWIEAAESAVGIFVHDVTDGLNTILLVTRSQPAENTHIIFLLADAAAPVVGGVLVVCSRFSSHQLALFLGATSRLFLLTATGDLLPDAHRLSPNFRVSLATVTGIALIGVATPFARA